MKILHLGKYFPPYRGGMETYLRDLMTQQSREGLLPSALVHQSKLSLNSSEEVYESCDQKLPVVRAALWARLLFTPISPTFYWLLKRLIKQERPDVLHIHMPNVSAFWALLLPSARNIPWVIHWHADVVASSHHKGLRLFYKLYRPFEQALLKRAAAIIATSPPYLHSSEPLAMHKHKCHVVPLGLDPAALPMPKQCSSLTKQPDTPLRVLAVGRLTYYKGFEHLIRAAAITNNLEVYLVGTGEQEQTLKRLITELKLESRVTLCGQLPAKQLVAQFDDCDCLCLPSIERTEAFGVVLLEAMYFGKASVVSQIPGSGVGWVVNNGENGMLFPVADVASLAECLRTLQQNPDKVAEFGASGRQRFSQIFTIEASTKTVTNIYRTLET